MSRTETIAKVKELGIVTPRPAHMMSTVDLENLIPTTTPKVVKEKGDTMKIRIEELSKEGVAPKAIVTTLEAEGWASKMKCGKVRLTYVKLVIDTLLKK